MSINRSWVVFVLLLCGPWCKVFAQPLSVVTTIKPLELLIRAVGGEHVSVETLISPNADPHNVSLKMSSRRQLQQADLLVWMGPTFEPFLAKVADAQNRAQVRVDLVADLQWLAITDEAHVGDHETENDVHIWLDPPQTQRIATAIAKQIMIRAPELSATTQQNLDEFIRATTLLDSKIKNRLAQFKQKPFVAYHDAYQYMVHRYDLNQVVAVNQRPEHQLSARQMAHLQGQLAGAYCLLAESPSSSAQKLARQANIPLVVADPLGAEHSITTYGQLMLQLVGAFERCLQQ